jgi:hypothetical protein
MIRRNRDQRSHSTESFGPASSPAAFNRIEACSWKISLSGNSLAVLKRKHPRPRLGAVDKIFWAFARCFRGAARGRGTLGRRTIHTVLGQR